MITVNIPYFDLRRIMNSGQIFRMYEPSDGRFVVYSADRRLELAQNGTKINFYCDEPEFAYWKRYFDLDRDYAGMIRTALDSGDEFIKAACSQNCGIRILRQDLWEMLISFIISQQKQIPSIRKCIEALCERFGERSDEWYTFPTAEAIAAGGAEGLKGLSLGYRERYIYETSVEWLKKGLDSTTVENMELTDALKYFRSFTGVGEKVANCVALFGAGFVDAFPIDTHIKDILYREYYLKEAEGVGRAANSAGQRPVGKQAKVRCGEDRAGGRLSPLPQDKLRQSDYEELAERHFSRFAGYRGIVQQWIFAYELNI